MISQMDVLIFILTIIVTALFTAAVRRELLLADIRDNPIVSEHRQKSGTPTMGGFGILIGVALIALVTFMWDAVSYLHIMVFMMFAAGIFGMFDVDRKKILQRLWIIFVLFFITIKVTF